MKTIDARGLSCPEPVVLTRNAMESKENAYDVLTDCMTARENVTRFAIHQGYRVTVEEKGEDFILHIRK